MTHFKQLFVGGVPVFGGPILTTGNVFFVDSGHANATDTATVSGANGWGKRKDEPFATIDYAIGQCTANNGDIILVAPGHTETVAAAGGIALDVAGVSIIGIGSGSDRPTINFTATASTMTVSAANCTVDNLLFTGGIDAVVSYMVISAADVKILNCEYRDVTGQCTDGILTTAGANRLLIKNYRHDGATAAGTNAGIAIVGGDGIVIDGLRMDGNFAVGGIDIRTTATTDLEVRNVMFRTRNAADIFIVDTITASTGMIGPNLYIRLNDNAANITEAITGATFVVFDDVYIVNNAGEKAMLTNITASTDA